MQKIFIIEDERTMAECIALSLRQLGEVEIEIFGDVIAAIQALDDALPDLICLDVLLDGPDGFTLLNELSSYSDTAQIPIIIISSLELPAEQLAHYGVVALLDKATMRPAEITAVARAALEPAQPGAQEVADA